MDDITAEFKSEACQLVIKMREILDHAELSGTVERSKLQEFSLYSDRIQGGAKTLALRQTPQANLLERIGKYTEIFKALGYRIAELSLRTEFFVAGLAVLLDSLEIIDELALKVSESTSSAPSPVENALLDRLQWFAELLETEMGQGDLGLKGLLRDLHSAN